MSRKIEADLPTIEVSEDIGEVSDGYHTFNQLYHQRAVLFATIVNQNKDKAWKSWKHEDGQFCFDKGGEWFVVGVDTLEGSYTYHYEKKYWDMFDCEELDKGKHWDGHTEEDVTRLLSLPLFTPIISEDAISREWLKEQIEEVEYENAWHMTETDKFVSWENIENAPSVASKRAEGEWIVSEDEDSICSVCGESEEWFIYGTENWYGKGYSNYCPNCGAKMKGAGND